MGGSGGGAQAAIRPPPPPPNTVTVSRDLTKNLSKPHSDQHSHMRALQNNVQLEFGMLLMLSLAIIVSTLRLLSSCPPVRMTPGQQNH